MQKLWSFSHLTSSGNGSGSGIGDRAWYRFRYQCEIQFQSGPSSHNITIVRSCDPSMSSDTLNSDTL